MLEPDGTELTAAETQRYARQMIIPSWGEATQRKLKASKIFIAGAGGLGSPVSFNLAVAGIGLIRICDFDSPELSNLNRQFLHDDSRVGMNKAESAKRTLSRLNPHVRIEAITEKIDEASVDRLVADSDLILDCMDNYPTRFVLNAAAIRKGIPLIHGSIWGFEGRVTFIQTPETACLACLFKEAPPREVFPVLGATPGITGTIQAMEAIKYLAGVGSLLKGRLLCCDFLEMHFFEVKVRRDPACPACGRT
ncbi:MAG TPA: HesA/MoeB/ThiF family protein [Candidatus Methylomirabilis sp.]|nr:HesA/MoeB/ThiF family protein [Candidatus Methylomirabilis sp.]